MNLRHSPALKTNTTRVLSSFALVTTPTRPYWQSQFPGFPLTCLPGELGLTQILLNLPPFLNSPLQHDSDDCVFIPFNNVAHLYYSPYSYSFPRFLFLTILVFE